MKRRVARPANAAGKARAAPEFAPWPAFSKDEIQAAARVLASGRVNYWTGDEGRAFEREFAQAVGAKHAVALANGSVALELALYALGIGAGDEVVVPSRSFIASASCVLMRGARPVFAEVDAESGNVTAATLEPQISKRTRALLLVHLGGWPCEMAPILKLARARGLRVIEDCAQAQGASYRGRPVGAFGDVAAFSFCQDKIMTTGGEGGMLVTSDPALFRRAWSYKDHGRNHAANDENAGGFRWVHDSAGTNWRMTEMQSALGRLMLPKIAGRVARRQRHAAILARALAGIPALHCPRPPQHISAAYYRYYACLRPERLAAGWNRDRVQAAIAAEGVPCRAGSCSEIYLERAFPKEMRPPRRFPVARRLGETSLAFLVHPNLDEAVLRYTAAVVEKVMQRAAE